MPRTSLSPASRSKLYVLAALCLVAIGGLVFRPHEDAAAAGPFRPKDDADVLELLPTGATDPRTRELAAMRRELARDPKNLELATRLARRNIEEGRARSDPRYLGYAEAALAPWWREPTPPPAVLVLRATIHQSTHDFDGALADLDRVVEAAPNDAQAWLTRSVVLGVRGDYAEAMKSCERVAPLARADVTATCVESLRSLTGHAKDAYAKLSAAAATARARAMTAEEAAWMESTLGEIAVRAGDAAAAERHFQAALAADPADGYVLGAYADLLLDMGRAKEVLPKLAERTQNDGLLLRLALAETIVGDARAAAHVAMLRERFDASRSRDDTVHRREESRYARVLENDAPRALELAKANFGVQREPWDVRVLLEAALATGDRAAAAPALELLAKSGLEEPAIIELARKLGAGDAR